MIMESRAVELVEVHRPLCAVVSPVVKLAVASRFWCFCREHTAACLDSLMLRFDEIRSTKKASETEREFDSRLDSDAYRGLR